MKIEAATRLRVTSATSNELPNSIATKTEVILLEVLTKVHDTVQHDNSSNRRKLYKLVPQLRTALQLLATALRTELEKNFEVEADEIEFDRGSNDVIGDFGFTISQKVHLYLCVELQGQGAGELEISSKISKSGINTWRSAYSCTATHPKQGLTSQLLADVAKQLVKMQKAGTLHLKQD